MSGAAKRLQTMPGVGPMIALSVEAFAPAMDTISLWPRFCCMAWTCASTAFHDGISNGARIFELFLLFNGSPFFNDGANESNPVEEIIVGFDLGRFGSVMLLIRVLRTPHDFQK